MSGHMAILNDSPARIEYNILNEKVNECLQQLD
jgi:hypothetical protein